MWSWGRCSDLLWVEICSEQGSWVFVSSRELSGTRPGSHLLVQKPKTKSWSQNLCSCDQKAVPVFSFNRRGEDVAFGGLSCHPPLYTIHATVGSCDRYSAGWPTPTEKSKIEDRILQPGNVFILLPTFYSRHRAKRASTAEPTPQGAAAAVPVITLFSFPVSNQPG